jgi:hypothetical protein
MSKKNHVALEFRANEYVVYPAHGVGKIVSIEKQEIAGMDLELFVISFEKDKMTLRVPTAKATSIGMRSLSSPDLPGVRAEDPFRRSDLDRRGRSRSLSRRRPAGAVLFRAPALRSGAGAADP